MSRTWNKWLHVLISFAMVLTTVVPVMVLNSAQANTGLTVQNITDDGVTAMQMAQTILGDGVLARKKGGGDLDSTAYTGSGLSGGIFTGGGSAFGVEEGIILSTGPSKAVVGTSSATTLDTVLNTVGDADLKALGPGGDTYDASSLEFDFKLPDAASDKVEFQFVLASDEYPEYVDDFFDIMGLYINGQNVALIPGTTQPVSIGNVNHLRNTDYYVPNPTPVAPATTSPRPTALDGMTTVLTATANINAGQWNTIKLAIADYKDRRFDSSVLIQANSLRAPENIKFSNVTGTGFSITWSPVEDVTTYDLYLRNDGVDTFIGTSTRLSYTFTGLKEYANYVVIIKSRNVEGEISPPSAPITVRTKDVTVPDTPTDVEVESKTATSVKLKWTASTDGQSGIAGYNMYRDNVLVTTTAANATSYEFTGLTSHTLYGLTVAAVDVAGNMSKRVTLPVRTVDDIKPNEPVFNVPVFIKGKNKITLSWAAATDNDDVKAYRIFRNLPADEEAVPDYQITSCGTTGALGCEVTGLAPGTLYKFTVLAEDQTGNLSTINRIENTDSQTQSTDSFTNEIMVRTLTEQEALDTTAPTQPGQIAFAERSFTGFKTTWGASTDSGDPTSGLAGYEVSLREGTAPFQMYTTVTEPTYTFAGLDNNKSYTVRICAVDNAGNRSTCRDATTTTIRDNVVPVLANPLEFKAVNKTESSFTLEWNTGSTDNIKLAGFNIYQNTKLIGTTDVNFFDVTENLQVGKTYNMTIRARDANGNLSAIAPAPPLAVKIDDITAPLIPLDLLASNILTSVLDLSWSESTDNLATTGYNIYQFDNATSQYTYIGTTADTEFKVTGLSKSTGYQFAVKAKDAAGNLSDFSEPITVTTAANSAPPSAPDSLFAEGLNDTQFLLTWETSEDDIAVKEYEIYYAIYNDDNEDDGFDPDTEKPGNLNAPEKLVETRVVRVAPNETTLDFLSTTIGDVKNINQSANELDAVLIPNKTYYIRIKAVDFDGNTSEFSDPLPFLLEPNTGPVVTVTRARGDLTRTIVSTNYTIGTTVLHPDLAATTTVSRANIKCVLRRLNGQVVQSQFERTTNPKTTFKKFSDRIGKKRCALSVENKTLQSIGNGTYYLTLIVEHPTATIPGSDPPRLLKTKIMRTIRVDKTAPIIKDVNKTNDIYGPDGKSTTKIRYRVDDDGFHFVYITDTEGKIIRTLVRRAKVTGCKENFNVEANCPFIEWTWNGKTSRNVDAPDGRYNVLIRVINLVRTPTENTRAYRASYVKTNRDGTTTTVPAVTGNTLSLNVENKSPLLTRFSVSPSLLLRKGKVSIAGRFILSERAHVRIQVLDKDGTEVRKLRDQIELSDPKRVSPRGVNTFSWDGRNSAGVAVPDGVYTIKVTSTDLPPAKVATTCTQATGQWPVCEEITNFDKKTTVNDVKVQLDGLSASLNFDSVTARTSGETVTVVDRATTNLALAADGTNTLQIRYILPEYANVTTAVFKVGNNNTLTLFRTLEKSKRSGNIEYTLNWNGKSATGTNASGAHVVRITATDLSGKQVVKEFSLNVTAP